MWDLRFSQYLSIGHSLEAYLQYLESKVIHDVLVGERLNKSHTMRRICVTN